MYDNYRLTPLPRHVIAGYVRDEDGEPMAGVIVSAGAAGSALTDNNGAYTFTGVLTGTYTLVPYIDGYVFAPESRTLSVPPGTAVQDFAGNAIRYIYLPCLLED